jgi:hypothetical protein
MDSPQVIRCHSLPEHAMVRDNKVTLSDGSILHLNDSEAKIDFVSDPEVITIQGFYGDFKIYQDDKEAIYKTTDEEYQIGDLSPDQYLADSKTHLLFLNDVDETGAYCNLLEIYSLVERKKIWQHKANRRILCASVEEKEVLYYDGREIVTLSLNDGEVVHKRDLAYDNVLDCEIKGDSLHVLWDSGDQVHYDEQQISEPHIYNVWQYYDLGEFCKLAVGDKVWILTE